MMLKEGEGSEQARVRVAPVMAEPGPLWRHSSRKQTAVPWPRHAQQCDGTVDLVREVTQVHVTL
jgi:hypothetical protein